mmetsp:Transcript_11404/g.10064  ORF Transcript_11404/g.10064 Transcript_11404/m.10064 type:complete len:117 (+) Transcript_11404:483-833(+)
MENMDSDKNGAINFNEFISATLDSNITRDFERIQKAFDFFDQDGDGYIDQDELEMALTDSKVPGSSSEIFIEVIKGSDLDNDGKISFDEFNQAMANKLDKITTKNLMGTISGMNKE